MQSPILKSRSYKRLSQQEKIQQLHCPIPLPVEHKEMKELLGLCLWQEVAQKP